MAETLGLFDSVAVTARSMTTEHFTDPDDDWEPILFVEGKTGTGMTPLGQFMRNDGSKDMLAEVVIPAVVEQFQATTVVMVLSTWTASVASKEELEPIRYVPPSQRPDRREQLLIIEYTREGVTRQAFAEIIRHENSPPTLGDWDEQIMDKAVLEGRFVEPIVKAMKAVST